MRRQLAAQLIIIEIGMQIGQDRTGGFDAGDPPSASSTLEMARVRPIAQRVHNPDFGPQARKRWPPAAHSGRRNKRGARNETQGTEYRHGPVGPVTR